MKNITIPFLAIQGTPDIPNLLTFLRHYLSDPLWLKNWEAIIFSLFIAFFISSVFYFGSRKRNMIPTGFQNFLEYIVESFRFFIIGILGKKEGEKRFPFLGTLFIYTLFMNLFGLVPLMKSPSSNLNVTLGLAICVFLLVQYLNIKNMGIKGFLYHLAGSPKDTIGWLIAPLMFPIELLTQISRPITLSLRLFGNILGEKILLAFFTLVSINWLFMPVQTPILFLGLLTSIMQAMVFTLLSTIYILLAVSHREEKNINQ